MDKIKTRLITCFQSKGGLGKSTFQQVLISWLNHAGVDFSAIDMDGEHKTLSIWYPDIVTLHPYRREDDLLPCLNQVGGDPVELIDFPAQATSSVLAGIHHFNALKIFRERQVRLTILIFGSDNREALKSAAEIVGTLGNEADYIVVKNEACFTSGVFDASKLARQLKDSPELEIPRLTESTIKAVDAASKQKERTLTFKDAEPLLLIGNKNELEHWRNRVFTEFEDHAANLLPDPAIAITKVERIAEKIVATVNPFDL